MAGLPATDFDVRLGGRLKATRERAGLTQKEMAKVIGVSPAQLQKYEGGRNRTPASVVQVIAHRFGTSVAYYFDPDPGVISRL